jgi:hypothetical protein
LTSLHSPAGPGPPETRSEIVVIVNGSPSAGKTSDLLVRVLPSPEIEIAAFRVGLPSLLAVIANPSADLVQVNIVPFVDFCSFPSHTTFGCAWPPRVTVKPSASVATEKVAPSYLSEDGSSFHEPFQGLDCAMHARLKASKHITAQTLTHRRFIIVSPS